VHLCLTLIIKELKFSVEHDRVVTTLNIMFSVVSYDKNRSCLRNFVVSHLWQPKCT
jgi:hypothetical protein